MFMKFIGENKTTPEEVDTETVNYSENGALR
jgi:hypothetical protein